MTLSFKLKLYLAWRRFLKMMTPAWAQYMGYEEPPPLDEVKKRNEREHGSTSSAPRKGNVTSKYRRKK